MRENKHLIWGASIGALFIFATWAISAILIMKYFPENDARGTFGDLFGAINALFSGLAFLGVIIAIILQKLELEEQRKEIKLTRLAHDESAKALHAQSQISGLIVRLEAINHVLAGLDRQISRAKETRRADRDKVIAELILKQQQQEDSLNKLLQKIEKLENELDE